MPGSRGGEQSVPSIFSQSHSQKVVNRGFEYKSLTVEFLLLGTLLQWAPEAGLGIRNSSSRGAPVSGLLPIQPGLSPGYFPSPGFFHHVFPSIAYFTLQAFVNSPSYPLCQPWPPPALSMDTRVTVLPKTLLWILLPLVLKCRSPTNNRIKSKHPDLMLPLSLLPATSKLDILSILLS